MEQSIFIQQEHCPEEKDLQKALGKNYVCWKDISDYVLEQCSEAKVSWHYSKAGWNCRISDHKRVLIYLMPCAGYFNASFVLGKKAVEAILSAPISDVYKDIIRSAKVYAEGAGFRLPVKTRKAVPDLKTLINTKCS